ncbi:MAG: SMP-30/gluconolactonase/LRE family protein [Gammaproteobacteria bacterium]|nr:SMP-30/gluconolactonase/LRE family protein [Gammaproteobacteria bacterium]
MPDQPVSIYPTTGSVERLDSIIDKLIPTTAKIEILADGFSWAEGPLWVEKGQYLLFSDVPKNIVYKWKDGEGKSVYLQPSGDTSEVDSGGSTEGANGLLLDDNDQLILCQHGDRRLAVMDAPLDNPRPQFNTITDNWQNKRFNSPNDAAFYKNGEIYFTDPPYGLANYPNVINRQIAFNGVYKVDHSGHATMLVDDIIRPNGIAFSPDYKTLYIANSEERRVVWFVYDVTDDGLLRNKRIFFDATAQLSAKNKGLADGMKVNQQGYIFATGPGGVLVFSPQGKHLGTVRTGQATANVAFGNNGQYLYMTASRYLMRIKLVNE